MSDINGANDFIASNCLTRGCRPENGLRVYFPKDIVAKRVANAFGIATLDEIVIHENRQGTVCHAEINWQRAANIRDQRHDTW